jgi:hypothetical protein
MIITNDDQKKTDEKFRGLLNKTEFEVAVSEFIRRNFKDWWNFRVAEETRIYSSAASEYIWEQEKGLKPLVVEVYYMDDYLCDLTSKTQPSDALEIITQSIMKLVKKQAEESFKKEQKDGDIIKRSN